MFDYPLTTSQHSFSSEIGIFVNFTFFRTRVRTSIIYMIQKSLVHYPNKFRFNHNVKTNNVQYIILRFLIRYSCINSKTIRVIERLTVH